ncbi:MAG: RNA 3'-terminal phosphate cyclase [Myxococcaceae bacterium]
MIELDGSEGEGGGQILRTSISLSLITGQPFRIQKTRAKRSPPGLRPQHLACVRGAEAISGSASEGASVGASELVFHPKPVKSGDYLLEVGTAGSTPLLFQCLFFPLALAGGGTMVLKGGTHLTHSPSFHYLQGVWLPAMQAYGLSADLKLRYAGFYPEGTGEFRAEIPAPGPPPTLLDIPARGTLVDVEVRSFVAGLNFDIADRQSAAALSALRERGVVAQAENVPLPAMRSRGTVVFIRAHFENSFAGFTALGEKGLPAEKVGAAAAEEFKQFLAGHGALDEHLCDQILLPASLLAAGRLGKAEPGTTHFTADKITDHLTTNARVIEKFLPVKIETTEAGSVRVAPK